MPNYQNAKLYKIIDLASNECYIGSTTLALSQRLAQHVVSYKRWIKNKTNFVTSFNIIANGDYDIVLIEKYPCNSKEELHARESYYSRTIPCVNKIKNQGLFNALGKVQYNKLYQKLYQKDEQYCRQYSKKYHFENASKVHFRKNTVIYCECGCSYTRANKGQHERSTKHQEYEKNKLYYIIQRGLLVIKQLDSHFANKE